MENIEIWKDIPNNEGVYQASSLGRLKTLPKYINSPNGKSLRKEKIFIGTKCKAGYLKTSITKNGVRHTVQTHRLVAITFIPNPKNKPCVNHKNGIKTDNRIENLEWCTHSENTTHAFKNGLMYSKKGSKANNVRLTEEAVIHIRKRELKMCEYMRLYNVSLGCIQGVLDRLTWKHI